MQEEVIVQRLSTNKRGKVYGFDVNINYENLLNEVPINVSANCTIVDIPVEGVILGNLSSDERQKITTNINLRLEKNGQLNTTIQGTKTFGDVVNIIAEIHNELKLIMGL